MSKNKKIRIMSTILVTLISTINASAMKKEPLLEKPGMPISEEKSENYDNITLMDENELEDNISDFSFENEKLEKSIESIEIKSDNNSKKTIANELDETKEIKEQIENNSSEIESIKPQSANDNSEEAKEYKNLLKSFTDNNKSLKEIKNIINNDNIILDNIIKDYENLALDEIQLMYKKIYKNFLSGIKNRIESIAFFETRNKNKDLKNEISNMVEKFKYLEYLFRNKQMIKTATKADEIQKNYKLSDLEKIKEYENTLELLEKHVENLIKYNKEKLNKIIQESNNPLEIYKILNVRLNNLEKNFPILKEWVDSKEQDLIEYEKQMPMVKNSDSYKKIIEQLSYYKGFIKKDIPHIDTYENPTQQLKEIEDKMIKLGTIKNFIKNLKSSKIVTNSRVLNDLSKELNQIYKDLSNETNSQINNLTIRQENNKRVQEIYKTLETNNKTLQNIERNYENANKEQIKKYKKSITNIENSIKECKAKIYNHINSQKARNEIKNTNLKVKNIKEKIENIENIEKIKNDISNYNKILNNIKNNNLDFDVKEIYKIQQNFKTIESFIKNANEFADQIENKNLKNEIENLSKNLSDVQNFIASTIKNQKNKQRGCTSF